MAKNLIVIGGVAAGPKAAAKARRCDPEMNIVIYQEEDEISYAGCGLPYYISGVIQKRDELVSRTPGKFASDGIRVVRHHRVEAIDLKEHVVSVRDMDNGQVFSDTFDRLVIAVGAQPIQPRISGLDLKQITISDRSLMRIEFWSRFVRKPFEMLLSLEEATLASR
jgi:NADPH-dependent 2,4-dienoyl-CoA reductase/sulfur reductase-like enzyme